MAACCEIAAHSAYDMFSKFHSAYDMFSKFSTLLPILFLPATVFVVRISF